MRAVKTWLKLAVIGVPALLLTVTVSGQNAPTQTFRATVDFVSTEVVVRKDGKFVPDLTEKDFKVYEDGVLQTLTLFEPVIGARSLGNLSSASPTRPPAVEGLIVPASKPRTDASGRLFVIFIDDFHFTAASTPQVKDLLKRIRDILVHENDLVGFVSSGYSSIEINPSYDFGHRRFNEAIAKTMGSAATPDEIIENANMETAEGPTGLRYNAHVAFKTAKDMIAQMSAINDRRKVFIYVSNGYSFDPFKDARFQKVKEQYADNDYANGETQDPNSLSEDEKQKRQQRDEEREGEYNKRTQFSFADLLNEVADIARQAQRANVTFYPIDPRGLMAGGDVADTRSQIKYSDWRDLRITQHNSLRVLSDETGGFCMCDTNDFDGGLRRIDAETSDFYRIGYTSNNPDPLKIRRLIKVEILRPGLEEPTYKKEYTIPKNRRN
jgi:VWFA-related protein